MKKHIQRLLKWSGLLLLIFGGVQAAHLYAVLHPGLFFEHSEEFGAFRVFSSEPIQPEIEQILETVSKRVEASELYAPDSLAKIVFANDGLYFALTGRNIIPRTIGNCIVVGGSIDISRNRLVLPSVEMNLVYVLTHELVHVGQHESHGLFMNTALNFGKYPSWKTEGYAEWIAQKDRTEHHGQSIKSRLALIDRLNQDQWVDLGEGYAMPQSYLRAHIMVEYLIEFEEMSYSELIDSPISAAELWEIIQQADQDGTLNNS